MIATRGRVRVRAGEDHVGMPVAVAELLPKPVEDGELERVGRKGEVAGYDGQAGLPRGVGDDKRSSVLPLVQPLGDLVRANKAEHRHADHRQGDVFDRSPDQVTVVHFAAGQAIRAMRRGIPG